MNRRQALTGIGVTIFGSTAGCIGNPSSLFETTSGRAPPLAEDRPNAVYLPTHVEGMNMIGVTNLGDLTVGLTYSYPHRFWTVKNDGGEYIAQRTDVEQDNSVHLMAVPWDPETGTVLPNTGLSVEITREDELVSEEVIYPMLSQRMGFHYGTNFSLIGDGIYDILLSVGGINVSRYGQFEGKFAKASTSTISFEFSKQDMNNISYERLSSDQGQDGAVEPMSMEMISTGDAPESLPGTNIGRGTSGDAVFVGTVVEKDRFGSTPYLGVSVRTPHNGLVIPGIALSVSIDDTESVVLSSGLDPELGFHYGATVEGLSTESAVEITVEVPPQVARHEGYETAFLEMSPLSLE
jgi:hypothetical protein